MLETLDTESVFMAAQQIPIAMRSVRPLRYGVRPVLLESLCEIPRFRGTCYRAANWIHLGQTQRRGKLDTRHQYAKPLKNIVVKPLCPDWKAILNR